MVPRIPDDTEIFPSQHSVFQKCFGDERSFVLKDASRSGLETLGDFRTGLISDRPTSTHLLGEVSVCLLGYRSTEEKSVPLYRLPTVTFRERVSVFCGGWMDGVPG